MNDWLLLIKIPVYFLGVLMLTGAVTRIILDCCNHRKGKP